MLRPGGGAVFEIGATEFVASLRLSERVPAERPYVVANFVMSADGNASFDGRSAPLSDPGDRALFHALRAGSDAIMAGTGTLATERYKPAVKPVVTVTRSGELPLDIPLFKDGGEVIVFGPHGSEPFS
ncbi:MAG: dihydrofolate reductase family protein, partial [Solirubrobacterales bacterium]|nr:dihydrofolate reductase family protein [Solirubrobacterales bacterium]